MKTVIFKKFGEYYTTTEENYYARIENARLTHRYGHASGADEIVKYFCEHFNSAADDFIIID